ncbi:MAG TPA: BamA/TamA family outer membrane protein [Planctomycetota bacterium]|nr:BamA/TamA family outer membrane protein [Planctomycetota bacterium]
MRSALAIALLLMLPGTAAAEERELEVRIRGNDAVSGRELRAAARRDLDGYERKPSAGALHDAAWAMEGRLRRQGHHHARVTFTAEPSADDARTVRFAVDEGPRVRIGDIDILGVAAPGYDVDELEKLIEGKRGWFESGDPVYVESRARSGAEKIERRYVLDGYLRARARLDDPVWSADRASVTLTVRVVEGRKYLVRRAAIELVPDAVVPEGFDAEVARSVTALQGTPYRARIATEAASSLSGWLRNHGHLHARVEGEPTVDDQDARADVLLRVDPGPEVRLRRIDADPGQGSTRSSFLHNAIDVDPGDRWNQERIDGSVRDLYRTGAFARVTAEPQPVPGRTDVSDLTVRVEEVEAREIDTLIGWGSYEMLRGEMRYRDKNLVGRGRYFDVGAEASMKSYGGDMTYRDPWSFGWRNELSVKPYALFREEPSYDRTEYGATAAFTHRYARMPVELTIGNRFSSTLADNIEGELPEVERDDFLRVSQVFTRISYDRRNSRVAPSRGWLVEAEVAISDPLLGADLSFMEYRGNARAYWPLHPRVVLAAAVAYATKQPLDGADTLPIQERLSLGGATTVRSFGQDELSPSNGDGDPIGGLTSALANVEARVRVVGKLYTAAFVDAGAIGVDPGVPDEPVGWAVGGGLRYLLPIGPIRVDAAWNPGETFAAEERWAIHVAVGFSF